MELKDSTTWRHLREGFAGEAQANRRYLYFARHADIHGLPEVASVFRDIAEGETGHAFGHLEFMVDVGDPVTGAPIGTVEENLKSAILGEMYECEEMYPGFARIAREEGFLDIAEWFETLARAERFHAARFQRVLDNL